MFSFITRSIHTTADWLFFRHEVVGMDLSTDWEAPLSCPQKQKHCLKDLHTWSRKPDNTFYRFGRQVQLISAHNCLWCHNNKITGSYLWKVCLEEQTGNLLTVNAQGRWTCRGFKIQQDDL